jgi:hypothetical protein
VPQELCCVNIFVPQKQTRLGRPKLPKGEAKTEMVRARVTKAEYVAVEAASKSENKELSEWVRDIMLRAAREAKNLVKP